MTEILIILVIALIVFGPRKLPELGKSLGKAMGQFRRASEDFKRTWEQEVEIEKTRHEITAGSSDDSYHSNYDNNSYDPYNSDYGYNAPSDAEVAATAETTEAATAEVATAEVAGTTSANKPQPGQWI
jgi:sec-independent protein translocase protein TatB